MLMRAFPDLLFDIVETIRSNRYKGDLDLIDKEEDETNIRTNFKIQRSANGWSFRVVIRDVGNSGNSGNWNDIRES
jgi:hypothetical protein